MIREYDIIKFYFEQNINVKIINNIIYRECKDCKEYKELNIDNFIKRHNNSWRGRCRTCTSTFRKSKYNYISKTIHHDRIEMKHLREKELQKCTLCKHIKEYSEFNNDKHTPSGKTRRCNECIKMIHGRSEMKEKAYFRLIKNQYGLSEEDYIKMYNNQNGKCYICNSENGHLRTERLFIDHNHNTGKVRGLLCVKCNTGLGMFIDNISNLKKAIKYLKKNGS